VLAAIADELEAGPMDDPFSPRVMAKPLSPAHAVLTELTQQEYGLDPADIPREAARMARLAAITARALADQVIPASSPLDRATWSPFAGQIRSEVLAIADELEGRADG
jgi:hypothetical protein